MGTVGSRHHVAVDATPTPAQRKAAIAGVFDRAAATYDRVGVDFFGPAGQLLVQATAPQPGERVLDLGCGRGASALPSAERVGPTGTVRAIDLAPAMVEALREQAAGLAWLQAEVGDAELPPPGPFDVVQAGLALFFLPDLSAALDRYREVLAPGGRLGFTWFGLPDPDWEPVFEALSSVLPSDQRIARRPGADGPFASVEAMEDLLGGRGWRHVTTSRAELAVRVRDADHWFAWCWSQGYRTILERIEAAGELPRARTLIEPLLHELGQRRGGLAWRAVIHVTTARR